MILVLRYTLIVFRSNWWCPAGVKSILINKVVVYLRLISYMLDKLVAILFIFLIRVWPIGCCNWKSLKCFWYHCFSFACLTDCLFINVAMPSFFVDCFLHACLTLIFVILAKIVFSHLLKFKPKNSLNYDTSENSWTIYTNAQQLKQNFWVILSFCVWI